MIVVDASAAVEILLQLPAAAALMDRLLDGADHLCAPELLDVEVAQVIRRYWRSGEVTPARGSEALSDLADLPIERYAHAPLLGRVWQLRNHVTAYDGVYLALAEAMNATLVTRDRALSRVPGVHATVEVF